MLEGPAPVELFGVQMTIGIAGAAGIISAVLWTFIMLRIGPFLRHGRLHAALVSITALTFVLLDIVLAAIIWVRPGVDVVRLGVAFVFGMQLVAAIAGLAFIQQLRRRR